MTTSPPLPPDPHCAFCWEIATTLTDAGSSIPEYRQIHHHAHDRPVERCHATSHGTRCSLPAGHPDDCRFPTSTDRTVEDGIALIKEARRWQIFGIDELLDALQLALQAGLDEIDEQRTRADTAEKQIAEAASLTE